MSTLFSARNVSFGYGDHVAVDDLSVDIEAGRFHGIIGPNGCGKSTFIDLLSGHRRPSAGRITYKERALSSYAKAEIAREMALVPQNFYINFPFSAGEVVMMGRYPHMRRFSPPGERDRDIVARVMARTDTEAFADRPVTQLSGGERQRVVFARALAQEASTMLLDEATSNLDIHHAFSVMSTASEAVRQDRCTVIAVMQDINMASAYCDRLMVMSCGRVAAFGPAAEVLTPGMLREVFRIDAKVYVESSLGRVQVVCRGEA